MSVFPEPDEPGLLARKTYTAMICPLRAWRPVAIARFIVQCDLINRTQLSDDEPLQFFTSGSVGEAIWKLLTFCALYETQILASDSAEKPLSEFRMGIIKMPLLAQTCYFSIQALQLLV
ncbi:MAG: hypothetical protein RLP02_16710 [Coleofasciculus sp. C2-GNP5-27]